MINDITLYQFKNYAEKKTIPFSALNIIYGSNGKGKSTMLQALMVLSQTLRAEDKLQLLRINGEFVSLDRFEDVLCSFAEEDEQEFHISLHSGNDFIETEYVKDQLPQRASLKRLKVNGIDYLTENAVESSDERASADEPLEIGYSVRSISDCAGLQQLKSLYYVSADRRGPVNSIKRNDNVDLGHIDVNGDNTIQVLYHHPELLSQLQDALSLVFKGATVHLPSDSKDDELKMLLDSNDNSQGYKPANVGFGYSHVLPIIVQVLLAKPGSIVIIENPEAHLHPGAQSRIVEFLISQMKEKSLQIFIESHSDHIINGARLAVKNQTISPKDANILFVSKDESDVRGIPSIQQVEILPNGALSEYFDDFMDEWTKQSGALL